MSDIVIDAADAKATLARKKRAARRRELRSQERSEVLMGREGVVWTLVRRLPRAKEVVALDGNGREVTQVVDTAVYCYSMLCTCGRTRYAKPNTVHQVSECRVCARATKLARRAERERGRPAFDGRRLAAASRR